MSPTRAQAPTPLAMPTRGAQPYISVAAAPDVALVGVIVTLIGEEPSVRVLQGPGERTSLPAAVYLLDGAQSLETSLRTALATQIGLDVGHLEQLGCNATQSALGAAAARLTIGYLALANIGDDASEAAHWRSWYSFFQWEDWRRGHPAILREIIEPRLRAWAELENEPNEVDRSNGLSRLERLRMAFGLDGIGWDEERVVERFDLMQQAGALTENTLSIGDLRTLAVAIGRLRSRIKSRPVVFDLMPERFTLFELQRTVEAILGPHLHKQNFRRLVEHMGLVEPTEGIKSHTGGRPAKLFKFRQSVLLERLQPGVRVRTSRS